MAFVKIQDRKCGNCAIIDRETYKAVKTAVCYLVEKKDGQIVAVAVTDKTPGCLHWRENK